jgi:exopolysaccharide biosynthesis polyprenyl glycosylphosphotransferase
MEAVINNQNNNVNAHRGPLIGGRPLRGIAGWLCRGCDLCILGAAFCSVVVLPYFAQNDVNFHDFLQMRISVRNLLVANICYWSWYLILCSLGIYNMQRSRSITHFVSKLMLAVTACDSIVALVIFATGGEANLGRSLALFWLSSFLAMSAVRVVLACFHRYLRPLMRKHKNLIIVGTGPQAMKAYAEMESHPEWRYNFLGFVDSDPQISDVTADKLLGGLDQLETILMQRVVDEVVIALPLKSQYEVVGRAVTTCEQAGIQSQYLSDYFGTRVTKRRYFGGIGATRVVMQVVHYDSRRFMKRAVDIVAAGFGIVFLSPLLLAAAIAVKTSRGPIIFKQQRFGLNKRKFTMYKFRSMVVDAEKRQAQVEHLNETSGPAFKIKNDPRVTRIGAIMRKLSIDELPQLFNVLQGTMSLVGPRPLPVRDVSRFSEAWLMRRFSVQPGLTCLWQVTGRSDTDFDRWVALDLQYIDNWSLALDIQILWKTLPAVLKGKGAH